MKEYIGAGIYAEIDGYGMLVLTTENGISVTNRIVFEGSEWRALVGFIERTKKEKNG